MNRQYLAMEEDYPVVWNDASIYYFVNRPIRAASAFAEAQFNDLADWKNEDERIVLVKDVESGEIWRFRIQGNITVDFDIECDRSFSQQEA